VPLYAQIQRDIEVHIATNQLRPGNLVPGEVDLGKQHGVRQVTVRKALRDLVT
jgi:DNA-binding GntR family transcriptional regulator